MASIRRTVVSGGEASARRLQVGLVAGAAPAPPARRAGPRARRGRTRPGPAARPVQRVPLQPGGAGLLPVLELLQRPRGAADRLGDPLAGRALAERPAQRVPLGLVQLLGDRLGLLLGGLDQRRGGGQRRAQAGHAAAARASTSSRRAAASGVGGQPARPADVPLRGPGRGQRARPEPPRPGGPARRRSASAGGVRSTTSRHRDRIVVDQFLRRRRAEQPHRARRAAPRWP